MKGKLIVIEGLDGSGKTTQIEELKKRLSDKHIYQIKLPDYDSTSSALVKMYLGGEFGKKPEDVNVYAASSFFAVDRFANYKTKWKTHYENGDIIISDRYTTSNAYHQASKLPNDKREEYFEWLENFEYNLLGIPKPDLVIYLDMPIEISQKMMTGRYEGDESKKDIHESNIEYLNRCREAAVFAAEKLGWNVITCAENDMPRSISAISNDVYKLVLKELS